jgi:hypothetical protein
MSNEVSARLTRALVAVVLLAGALCYSVAALELWRGGGPITGWSAVRESGSVRVSDVDGDGPVAHTLKIGDRLLTINTFPPVGQGLGPVALMDLRAGDTYQVTVERSGQIVALDLAMGRAGADRMWLTRWLLAIVSLAFFVSGCVIGLLRPDDRIARLYASLAMLIGIVLLPFGVFGGDLRRGFARAVLMHARVAAPIMFAVAYEFFRRFPPGIRESRVWLVIGRVITVCAALLVPAAVATAEVLSRPATVATPSLIAHAAWFVAYDRFSSAFILFTFAATAGVIVRNHFVVADAEQRTRLRWVMWGLLVGLLPMAVTFAWSASVETVTGRSMSFEAFIRLQAIAALFLAFLPSTFAYAVIRHRVIGIDVVIRKSLQYVFARNVLRAAIAIPLIILAFRAYQQTIAEFLLGQPIYLVLAVAATALLIVRRRLMLWLDRRFFRDQSERDQILLEAIGRVGLSPDDLDLAVAILRDAIDRAFHPRSLEIRLDSALNGSHTPAEQLETMTAIGAFAVAAPPGGLAVSIGDGASRVGVLLVGEKRSEEPYTSDEHRLLEHIAAQLALTADRAFLRGRVAATQQERYEVLARIDSSVNLLKECARCGRCYDRADERCLDDGTTLSHTVAIDRVIQDRYRVDRMLGRGGMGAVYAATDLRLQREVAVKLTTTGDNDGRRFAREAKAMARLHHPNIIAVHDYGVAGSGVAFLVMERLRGRTLRQEIRSRGAMTPGDVAAWLGPVADALVAAHVAGVIHRDLKPDNVFFDEQDGAVTPKVLDFGLAKISDANVASIALTEPGAVMGTLAYMPPEQLSGQAVDERSDVFAFGVMTIEALTGTNPFARAETRSTIAAVLNDTVRLRGEGASTIALDAALQKCIAKRADDRYPNASMMKSVLIRALNDCPAGINFAAAPRA